jgi:DnaA family protein
MTGRQLSLSLSPPPEPTLENFLAGSNVELLARLRAAAAGAPDEPVIYLWGEPGSGRTHLLHAVAAASGDGAYLAPDDAGYFAAAGKRVVAADDVERLDEARQIALFGLLNRARDAHGVVVAAGPMPPAGLALREDLKTRLGWGLVYRVQPLSDADKAQRLRAEAERRGLRLPDEVLAYLLARVPRDLGSLMSVLERLDRHSLSRQRPATVPLVRELLEDRDDSGA